MNTNPEQRLGFSAVTPRLYAMGRPGLGGDLDEDLTFVRRHVQVLVSLTEHPLPEQALVRANLESVHLPIQDFRAPTPEQLDAFLALVDDAQLRGESVGVHCTAGLGRSGTMMAAYLIGQGLAAEDATHLVRSLRPGSIETREQEQALRDLEARLWP